MTIAEFEMYFSYGQFFVFDAEVELPGNDWTYGHCLQGFARRESSVSFGTLLDFGTAVVRLIQGEMIILPTDSRAITVPFLCTSGKIVVDGPEEFSERIIFIGKGAFDISVVQREVSEENEEIRIYVEKRSIMSAKSKIDLQDSGLNPPEILIENCEIAQF